MHYNSARSVSAGKPFGRNDRRSEEVIHDIFRLLVLIVTAGWAGASLNGPATGSGNTSVETQQEKPGTEEESRFVLLRQRMVREQLAARDIGDPGVLKAMQMVERHRFVPESYRYLAYEDSPLPIGLGQTISQPYIVALMTQEIRPREGQRVLEIGTGSGYQAAILSCLVKEVYTVELLEELGEKARLRLQALGYRNVRCRVGDGWKGWPEAAPFDAILVTAAPDEVPAALVEQLAPGGRMIVPVGPREGIQTLLRIEKDGKGIPRQTGLIPVRFVPLVKGVSN